MNDKQVFHFKQFVDGTGSVNYFERCERNSKINNFVHPNPNKRHVSKQQFILKMKLEVQKYCLLKRKDILVQDRVVFEHRHEIVDGLE